MAWKDEKDYLYFNTTAEGGNILYYIARKYTNPDSILKEIKENGRLTYAIQIKRKNLNRLLRDIEVMGYAMLRY